MVNQSAFLRLDIYLVSSINKVDHVENIVFEPSYIEYTFESDTLILTSTIPKVGNSPPIDLIKGP